MAAAIVDPTVPVLECWFGQPDVAGPIEFREVWFKSEPTFDARIAEAFAADQERAASGALDRLMETAAGCLALVLLLDQFPRNMFRGAPRAFATDAKALAVTRHAFIRGFDQDLSKWPRLFLYLPLEHSEALADQERSVELVREIGDAAQVDYAVRHRDIIARFGRFPHRNAVLGRESTPEEVEFLKEEGSGF